MAGLGTVHCTEKRHIERDGSTLLRHARRERRRLRRASAASIHARPAAVKPSDVPHPQPPDEADGGGTGRCTGVVAVALLFETVGSGVEEVMLAVFRIGLGEA